MAMMLVMELRLRKEEGVEVMISCGNERFCCCEASHHMLGKSWFHIVDNGEWHQFVHIHDTSMVLMKVMKVMKVSELVQKRARKACPSLLD